MLVRCDCGAFQAELTGLPNHTPGRLVCYCSDCQRYLEKLGRQDLLDANGGTEILPVYPDEIRFIQGQEHLVCNQLGPGGLFRWSTRCCNTPVANLKAKVPWLGILHNACIAGDPESLKRFGPVRCRLFGRDAKGAAPHPVARKIGVTDVLKLLPFLALGMLGGKHRNAPFFKADDVTPIVPPRLL